MKSLQVIAHSYKSETLDGRDLNRLAQFIPFELFKEFNLGPPHNQEAAEWNKNVLPFTRENIFEQLEQDVAFGFKKALNKRGLSASLMFEVVRMWNWILEEGLEDWEEDNYAYYGLPLFKLTAVKYGFDNPIGDDYGDEQEYSDYDPGDYE